MTVLLLMAAPVSVYPSEAPQQKSATKGKKKASATPAKKSAAPASKKSSSATAKKKSTAVPAKKSSTTTGRKRKGTEAKRETSADVKRRQEATQKEIRLTEEQIRENDKSVKKGLNDLGKIEGDISVSKKKIAATTGKINSLSGQISSLHTSIAANEKQLKTLREEYLKAVRKMRVANKQKSDLAFIFASDNFNQALRRMRYLRQFSEWKERQSAAISGKTEQLRKERESLTKAKVEQDNALRLQQSEQATLRQQYARQDAIVADLKKNGDALKTHLTKKQAEANQLRNRISALIAEEQRIEAERIAAEKKAAEEKRLAEERAAEEKRLAEAKAAEEKAAEEKRLAEAGVAGQSSEKDGKSQSAGKGSQSAENEKKVIAEREKTKGERKKAVKKAVEEQAAIAKSERQKDVKAGNGSKSKDYAEARKRAPRSAGKDVATSKSLAAAKPAAKNAGGDFASMKGSLPRPVSGSFKVTSRFGRQSLPDLPDVVYDNPGIDAEVSNGASAVAVYNGKVSGVYMIPGYHTVVIVNHGNYYTVYGNISSPSVKVGDSVRAGQRLGGLAPDEDDRSHSMIHFEVWRNREKLNPLDWIR